MIHVIIVALLFTFGLVVWNLVHFAPRSVAMFLPDRVRTVLGLVLLPLGVFSALAAGHGQQNVEGLIGSAIIAMVGLWFLLIGPAGYGTTGDTEHLLRRVFLMMGLLMAVLVASFYIGDSRFFALVNLPLLAAGIWLARDYLRDWNRGR